jgi:phosphate transport system permease protein
MRAAIAFYGWMGTGIAILLAFAGGAFAFTRRSARAFRHAPGRARADGAAAGRVADRDPDHARHLPVAAVGIAALLRAWCRRDFLFGTHWSPQVIDPNHPGKSLGAVPLFWGTFFIGAVIAMLVAIPFGLMSAIYLTQYAAPTRAQAG